MSRLLRRLGSKFFFQNRSLLCAGTFTWAPYTSLNSTTNFEEEKLVTLTLVASEDDETTASEDQSDLPTFGSHHVIT